MNFKLAYNDIMKICLLCLQKVKNVKEKKKLLKNKYNEIFKYKGNIEVKELKYDIFEELDYDAEEVLCECRRLMHCKPLSHFIKYKNG